MITRLGIRLTQALNRPPVKRILILHSRCNNYDSTTSQKLEQQPKILASIESGFKTEPIQEMPPDAKTQAKTAFRQIGLVLRAMAYTTLGLGLTAVIGFIGIHSWVEFLELPPPGKFNRSQEQKEQDLYGWNLDLPGWSAGFIGKGTDSRIGWRARSLIRAAWVAQNWQSGQDAIQIQELDDQLTSNHTNNNNRLVDSAYLMSQSQLEEAISTIKQNNPILQPLDPTLVELELALANISERIHTPSSLKKAYKIYSQLSNSFINSIHHHHHHHHQEDSLKLDNWKLVQGVRTVEKLFQVGLQILDFERKINPSQAHIIEQESENKLIWAINHVLGIPNHCQEQNKSYLLEQSSPKSSWFSSFTLFNNKNNDSDPAASYELSHDPSSPIISLKSQLDSIQDKLSILSNQLESNNSNTSLSPIHLRLTISSLLKLSTHLVSINSLKNALEIQKRIHSLLDLNLKKIEIYRKENLNVKEKEIISPDEKLHEFWLNSRAALSATYLSQIQLALINSPKSHNSTTTTTTTNTTTSTLNNPKEIIGNILNQLHLELTLNNNVFDKKICRALSGRLSENLDRLIDDIRSIDAIIS